MSAYPRSSLLLPGSPTAWVMGLMLMPVAAGVAYALSLGILAGVLWVAGCSVAGLLASGHQRRWQPGKKAVIVVFKSPRVSQWACLCALLLAAPAPVALEQALRTYFVAFLPLTALMLLAGVVVLSVFRVFVSIEAIRIDDRHVSVGLLGAETRVEIVRTVGDRELQVVFENGRTFPC
jgi:hypothetical protein